eukprot:jgi/Psemu1/255028/estExt_Genewise1Plus.C_1240031
MSSINDRFSRLPVDRTEDCDRIDRVKAMLHKCESTYSCSDYIRRRSRKERNSDFPELVVDPHAGKLDTVCREKMCEWSYRVCDHFRTGREIVAVSMSYLDRFVDKCTCDRSAFKLAAMTTLYMANKIYGGPQAISIGALAELSRGEFERSHISEMEAIILKTLEWRLHPPTAQCFIDSFFRYLPLPSSGSLPHAIYRRAMFFAELSVYDFAFVSKPRSLIAVASLVNAMEGMESSVSEDQQFGFLETIQRIFQLPFSTDAIEAVRNRLWYVYSMSAQCKEDNAIAGVSATTTEDVVAKDAAGGRKHGFAGATGGNGSGSVSGDPSSSPSTSPVSVVAATGPHHR